MVVWPAVVCIRLDSDAVSYLVSDRFSFTKMGISKSSGMLHLFNRYIATDVSEV
jgi:hypothetical protein